jgi:hypothetical protein
MTESQELIFFARDGSRFLRFLAFLFFDWRWYYWVEIRDNERVIISDCLTLKTRKSKGLFDSVEDSRPDENVIIQWKDIKSCKINKRRKRLTVKNIWGTKITIGREFDDYLKIWSLIIERAKQENPDADIDNLIIEREPSMKDFV